MAADPIQIAPRCKLCGSALSHRKAMFQRLDVFCFGRALLMHRSNKMRLPSINEVEETMLDCPARRQTSSNGTSWAFAGAKGISRGFIAKNRVGGTFTSLLCVV